MKKSHLRKIIKEEISKVLNKSVNEGKKSGKVSFVDVEKGTIDVKFPNGKTKTYKAKDVDIYGGADDDIVELGDKVVVKESVNEARFVKDFDKKVLKATTMKEIQKIYPDAKWDVPPDGFLVGKGAGEPEGMGTLEKNLIFRVHFTTKKPYGKFKIVHINTTKRGQAVELYDDGWNDQFESVKEGLRVKEWKLNKTIKVPANDAWDLNDEAQYLQSFLKKAGVKTEVEAGIGELEIHVAQRDYKKAVKTIQDAGYQIGWKESVNESEATPEMVEQVQAALPDLEKLIQKRSGVKVKLMAEMNRGNLRIYSDNLIGQISPLGKTVFKEIKIYFWGGTLQEKENQIWFNPKTSYEHPSGGSNGADFIWQSLWFKLDDNAWVEGNRALR